MSAISQHYVTAISIPAFYHSMNIKTLRVIDLFMSTINSHRMISLMDPTSNIDIFSTSETEQPFNMVFMQQSGGQGPVSPPSLILRSLG